MMNKKWMIAIVGGSLLLFGATAWAEGKLQTIQVLMEKLNVSINGQQAELAKESIVYNGSVYVPLRSMSEMLGAEVSWNNTSRTVNLDFIADKTKEVLASSEYGIYQYIALENNGIMTDLIKALKTNDGENMGRMRDRYHALQLVAEDLKDEEMKVALNKLGVAVELLRGGWESKNLDGYAVAWSIYGSNADLMNKMLKERLNSSSFASTGAANTTK
ncbi:stalk domain-containing protein [Paenibacillus agricola]|uniref:Copper amine oxidase N-terminal domain-containing protein n=1 Tax=Paenibacillus agricola TaxID=2716264 RepID=A0ABX0J7B9_9BACL|nr:stalk domain-containing protein [Paenibacillus agricola]NHN30733.1 copper amine oxidase N-terminal domain-containing protein [Paenibacillus agricola]